VARLRIGGKMINASKYGQASSARKLVLTEEEVAVGEVVRDVWKAILGCDVESETEFFASGAGSMEVVR
jgi:formyltetrahydrofolate dehydrogenase